MHHLARFEERAAGCANSSIGPEGAPTGAGRSGDAFRPPTRRWTYLTPARAVGFAAAAGCLLLGAAVPARGTLAATPPLAPAVPESQPGAGAVGLMPGLVGPTVPPPVRPVTLPRAVERPLVVVLDGTPLGPASTAGEAAALRGAQDAAAAAMTRRGGRILARYEVVLDGLLVDPGGSSAARLTEGVPGLRAVYAAPRVAAALKDSVPFIGARRVAEELGVDGAGTVVAIVDSGVDYTHAALGGEGDPDAFAANDPAVVEPGSFPTVKVVGGWDFAGSLYDPTCPIPDRAAGRCSPDPSPDADPLDEHGHGTHVASIAAGLGSASVGSGVAPGASLVALKIFGRGGTSDLLLDALEWIVRVRYGMAVPGAPAAVDVVNLSLGAPYAVGILEEEGVLQRVVDSGVVVVAAAGNEGDHPYIVGSPGAASSVLAVGASYAAGEDELALVVRHEGGIGAPGSTVVPAVEANFTPQLADGSPLEGPVVSVADACAVPSDPVRDAIALAERGTCTAASKVARMAEMGARALVVYTDDRPVEPMEADERGAIPAVMIARQAGQTILSMLADDASVRVTLDGAATLPRPDLTDALWSWSSAGPSATGALEPDLSAPGANIVAAAMGTGTGARRASGTSMAAPHVGGTAALIVARGRRLGRPRAPDEVAARLTSSAAGTLRDEGGDAAAPYRAGAGRLDAWRAVNADIVGRGTTLAGLDFGRVLVEGDTSLDEVATVTNTGSTTRRLRPVLAALRAVPGVTASLADLSPVVLDPGATAPITVHLDIHAVDLASDTAIPVRGGDTVGRGNALADTTAAGYLRLVEEDERGVPVEDGEALRLAWALRAEAPSRVRAESSTPSRGGAAITLRNAGVGAGAVEAFEWLGDDGADRYLNPSVDVRDVGVRARRDASGTPMAEFAVAFDGSHAAAPEVAVLVYLDTNRDGALDWLVVGVDPEQLFNGTFSGQWATVAAPFPPGSTVPDWTQAVVEYYGDVRLDGSWVVLPVALETVGIGDEPFDFFVSTEDRLWNGAYLERVDVAPGGVGLQSPTAFWRFSPAAPDVAPEPATLEVASGKAAVLRARVAEDASEAGVLLLFPRNVQDRRDGGGAAQVVRLRSSVVAGRVYAPAVAR